MSKRGRVRTNLEYAAVRSFLSGLGLLPRPLALGIGHAVGRIAYRASRRLRQTGERNLKLAFPEMGERERERILRGCFNSLGRQLGEFSQFSKLNAETLRQMMDCEGLEHLAAAQARGRGAIIFTAHLGAWELLNLAVSGFGYPSSVLVRRIDNPKVERLVEQTRTRFGNRTIDKRAAALSMMRTLRAGERLGLLIDTNMLAHEGIFVDFFGTPASTTFITAKLALRTGADVMPCFAPWDEQRRRFVLHIGAPLHFERTGHEEEDIRRLTALLTKVVEDYVRRYPDQWLWIHKRWRRRPEGEPDIYQEAV